MKNRIKYITSALLIGALVMACSQQGESTRQYESLTLDQHKQLLSKRALANWDTMVRQEFEKQYAFYDPVFRAHVPLDEFLRSRRKSIHYSNPDIREIKIHGRIADLTVAVDVEVRQMMVPGGRVIDRPKAERVMPERWLWLDGDWYREYKSSKTSFIRY